MQFRRWLGWGSRVMVAAFVLTSACRCDEEVSSRAAVAIAGPFGYEASLEIDGASLVYLFAPGSLPRFEYAGSTPPTVTLRSKDSTKGLAVERIEHRGTASLAWYEALPLRIDERATLDVEGQRFEVRVVRSDWPQIIRALASASPIERLGVIIDTATTTLERLSARLERARSFEKGGDVDAYRREQVARAEAAVAEGYFSIASDALSAAAYYAYRTRRYQEVESLVVRSIVLARRVDYRLGEARAELMRGYARHELGRYRAAMASLERAADLTWTTGADSDLAFVQKALGVRQQDLGLHEAAIDGFERVAPYFENEASGRGRASYLADRGWVWSRAMARGRLAPEWNVPRRDLERGLELARELGLRDDEQTVLANLTWLEYAAGDRSAARRRNDELRAVAAVDHSFGELFADLMLARIDLADGRPEHALEAAQRAVDRAHEHAGERPSEWGWRALYVRGLAQDALGRSELARGDYKDGIAQVVSLARFTELTTHRLAFFDETNELYNRAILSAAEAGDPSAAFELVEKRRVRLLDGLARSAQRERLDAPAAQRRAELRAAYLDARARSERLRSEGLLMPRAERALHDKKVSAAQSDVAKRFDALQAWWDERGAASTHIDAAAIRAHLGHDAVLVSIDEAAPKPLAFRVDARGVERIDPPSTAEGWRSALGDASLIYLTTSASSRERRFVEMARAVIEQAAVALLPSASALVRPRRLSGAGLVVVADPASDLSSARAEGERVARQTPDAQLFLQQDATRDRVWAALQSAAGFHYAGHAVLDATNPWDARLELADGETITLEDVLVEPPPLRHVVLNGCRTGSVARGARELSIGLPDAFMIGGATSVLATFHDVSDDEASAFVASFYAAGGADDPIGAYRTTVRGQVARGEATWRSFYPMGAEPMGAER